MNGFRKRRPRASAVSRARPLPILSNASAWKHSRSLDVCWCDAKQSKNSRKNRLAGVLSDCGNAGVGLGNVVGLSGLDVDVLYICGFSAADFDLAPIPGNEVTGHLHEVQSAFGVDAIFAAHVKTRSRPVAAKKGVVLHVPIVSGWAHRGTYVPNERTVA